MKKSFKHARIIYVLLCTVPLSADNAMMRVMFDTLFPVSPFKTVLTHCMQVRNALEAVQNYHGNHEDYTLLCDIMAGRMAYLESSIVQLGQQRMHAQDIEYLLTIIDYMDHEVVLAFKDTSQMSMLHMQSVVANIKVKLAALLELAS